MKYNELTGYELDFERIHKVMELLNWHWFPNLHRVPTIEEIRENVEQKIQSLKDDPHCIATRSGGITVERQIDGETKEEYFYVAFEVDSAEYRR